MAGGIIRGGLVGVVLGALTACGGGGGTSASTTTTTAPPAVVGFAECRFASGGPVTTAGLATTGPNLAVSWDTPETVPTSDSSALVMTVGPYRIGFQRDGVALSRYLFDSTTGEQTDLTGPYTEAEHGISLVVPLSSLPEIRQRTRWHAAVNVDGSQVARCPTTGSSRFGDTKTK